MITIHCDDVITYVHTQAHTHADTHTQGDPGIDGDDGTPGNPGRMGPPGKAVSGTLLFALASLLRLCILFFMNIFVIHIQHNSLL